MGKYEEALERARQGMPIDEVFPELKESEDERVRKEMIYWLKGFIGEEEGCGYTEGEIRERIAYLERQKPTITIAQLKSFMLQYLQDAANKKDDSEIEADTDKWAKKILEYSLEQKPTELEWLAKLREMTKEMREAFERGVEVGKRIEQKPAEYNFANNESEYDKGYREGHRFGLKQTQEYMLSGGKTFSGLIPCWVNAPSELQPAHKYHGKNVVVMHENNGGFKCTCIDDERAITFHLPENTLFVEGWRKKPVEWSEEFLRLMGITISQDGNQVCVLLGENLAEGIAGFGDTLADAVEEFKKEWRQFDRFRKATWKPSEEQMEALAWYSGNSGVPPTGDKAIKSLYNDLKKL